MKKKILILCSLIGVLLAFYSFPIYAEDSIDPASPSPQIDIPDYALDSYFYENYDLLPYIQSDGNQYIITGVNSSSNYKIDAVISDLVIPEATVGIFGASLSNELQAVNYSLNNDKFNFYFYNNSQVSSVVYNNFIFYHVGFDRNVAFLNNWRYTFADNSFTGSIPIYIFARNNNTSSRAMSSYKLYSFYIYDYSLNDGDGGYVRYYYPAKAKASGVIGLYDSITKTFVTTSGSVPFASPTDDNVLNFQISDFLTAGLGWIGDIFTAIIDMPLILMFMAIGLAGVAFRWARRVAHF